MHLTIQPKNQLKGTIKIPGDKSISHRAVMLGAISEGITEVENFLVAEDCLNTIKCFQTMGIEIEGTGTTNLIIHGKGLHGLNEPQDVLNVGNSGTTIRLIMGILAGQPFYTVLTGDESIRKRPMDRIVIPLRQMGATILGRANDTRTPLTIKGGKLKPIQYHSPVASAQIKSAILLAGLYANGTTSLTEPSQSRDHTERMLKYLGAQIQAENLKVTVKGNPKLTGKPISIPGDLSSAAFFIIAATITKNSEILIQNVGINPTRTGIIKTLQQMGADIQILNPREWGCEPVADLLVHSHQLKGISLTKEHIPSLIDEIPLIAVAACRASGETIIRGAEELRLKEADRIAGMVSELRKLGAQIQELPDGMVIPGNQELKGNTCQSHGDHRIAMALAIAGLVAEGKTIIENTECINTSFPEFENILKSL